MYVKFSFLEIAIIIPQLWGGLVVNVVGKPEMVDVLPEHKEANTYITNEPCSGSEVNNIMEAAKEERRAAQSDETRQSSPDYKLAKKIAKLLTDKEYLANLSQNAKSENDEEGAFDSSVATFNSNNEANAFIIKNYYYNCSSVSKNDIERSINVLNILFNDFNIVEYGADGGMCFIASDKYPQFNPILEIFCLTIKHVQAALPEHCGSLLSKLGLNRILGHSCESSPTEADVARVTDPTTNHR